MPSKTVQAHLLLTKEMF